MSEFLPSDFSAEVMGRLFQSVLDIWKAYSDPEAGEEEVAREYAKHYKIEREILTLCGEFGWVPGEFRTSGTHPSPMLAQEGYMFDIWTTPRFAFGPEVPSAPRKLCEQLLGIANKQQPSAAAAADSIPLEAALIDWCEAHRELSGNVRSHFGVA